MPDAIITATESTFGTISGTFSADQSTVTGTVTGVITGTLDGSVGVPGPAGPGVPAGGTAGQILQKIDGTNYNTDWVTVNFSATWGDITGTLSNQTDLQTALDLKAPLASPALTGVPTAPTAATLTSTTQLATTAFVQQELLSGTANARNLEVYVRNQTGSTLAAGTIVYINGATGNRPTVTPAQANNDANSAQTFGFTKASIANNGFGFVIVRGELENIDTSALTEGVQLYLSPTTAGTWTTTKPSAPQHLVYVGIVVRAHPTQGVILVAVQNGYELDELHDVAIASKTNNDLLAYESSTDLWKNKSFGTLGLLTSATAASTYAPLAGATFTGVVGFNGASGNVAAKSTGYFKAYTSGLENTDYSLQYDTGLQVVVGGTTVARIASSGILAPSAGITFSDASTQTSAGITAATAASTYYLQTNPAGYITSAALSGYATESFVTSQGYITSSALTPYLTTATAASTYFTIASAANKADLASPTFTGVPAAPTASPGTNTTQLATTAFVTAAVPAFATLAESIGGAVTNKTIAPDNAEFLVTNSDLLAINRPYLSGATSGTGASAFTAGFTSYINAPTGGAGHAVLKTFGLSQNDQLYAFWNSTGYYGINFSKRIHLSGRCAIDPLTDTNITCYVTFGKLSADAVGNLTRKGIGWKYQLGGGSNYLNLIVHNGTSQTAIATTFQQASAVPFSWDIVSDGSGGVKLYINGVERATTSSGPTGTGSSNTPCYTEEIVASAGAAVAWQRFTQTRGFIYVQTK
jgi:hypothetical protein